MPRPFSPDFRRWGTLSALGLLVPMRLWAAEIPDLGLIQEQVKPLLKELCADCHNPDKLKGDFNLLPLLENAPLSEHREDWEKVAEALRERDMPPEKKPQPKEAQRESLVALIEGQLAAVDDRQERNPGKVTLRRLNREEYRNTIRDLLRVDFQPDDFPNDEVGYGFDNIADVLSLPPLLMEKFLAAAETIATRAIVLEVEPKPQVTRWRGEGFSSANEWIRVLENRHLGLYREGEGTVEYVFPVAGQYTFRLRAYGEQAGPEAPRMALRVGGQELQVFEVRGKGPGAWYEVKANVEAGSRQIAVAFLNNYNDSKNPNPKLRGDRNLFLESMEVVSPPLAPLPPGTPIPLRSFHGLPGTPPAEGEPLAFGTNSQATTQAEFKNADEYVIRVRARGERAGLELPKLRIALGGKELKIWEIKAQGAAEETCEVRVRAAAGSQELSLSFLNDYYEPNHPDAQLRGDRNLSVQGVEIVGPLSPGSARLPESHRQLVPNMPQPGRELEMAREILTKLAGRAYRRPPTAEEVDRLVGLVDQVLKDKGGFLEGLQVALQAVLCSPRFLFRWELDPAATRPGEIRHLSDYEVASRLSYFLWTSMPDEELFRLAERGQLLQDGNLEKQAVRMLNDPKARALVNNFAGQWLQIRNMFDVTLDPAIFPAWDDSLKLAMKEETERFFEAIMREDRPLTELLDANFTFLNEKLARFYGIEGVEGGQFQRVALPAGSPRGGVLTQGSVLLATATPTRTSPVIRGKWILEQILGTPPPPPPPNVPPLETGSASDRSASLRQRLEAHRSQVECAGCHTLMDPLGFALENFDATGAWREKDGPFPIDASGKLRGAKGETFQGPIELKQVLKKNKNFVRCLTEKMLIYSLGRGLEYYDRRSVSAIIDQVQAKGGHFHSLILAVVTSEPFLLRKPEVAQN